MYELRRSPTTRNLMLASPAVFLPGSNLTISSYQTCVASLSNASSFRSSLRQVDAPVHTKTSKDSAYAEAFALQVELP